MKERPILFSGPMVRAILDGRKTQTRRVVKPQPAPNRRGKFAFTTFKDDEGIETYWLNDPTWGPVRCPYGAPGDRLWVREAWQAFFADEVPSGRPRGPRHTMGIPAQPERESFVYYRADGEMTHPEMGAARWRSSLHMPRWASRLTLEVVSVRVERVQDISEEDALAEGADGPHPASWHPDAEEVGPASYTDGFRELWDSINGKRAPWESNPWAWVIEFRQING